MRNLACGVLGANVAKPFKKDTLKQELLWDFKDDEGKSAEASAKAGCKVRVAVGLTPRFDRFVAHDPAQLSKYVCGLEVDPKGRLYVTLFTELAGVEDYLHLSPENKWWRCTLDLTRASLKAADGNIIVQHPALGGILDTLTSMRGTENLLADLLDQPELVKHLGAGIRQAWVECYQTLYGMMADAGQDGTSTWMGLWARGRWHPSQCDFSAMLSPDMFAEFVVPNLKYIFENLDTLSIIWMVRARLPIWNISWPSQS